MPLSEFLTNRGITSVENAEAMLEENADRIAALLIHAIDTRDQPLAETVKDLFFNGAYEGTEKTVRAQWRVTKYAGEKKLALYRDQLSVLLAMMQGIGPLNLGNDIRRSIEDFPFIPEEKKRALSDLDELLKGALFPRPVIRAS